VPEGLSAVFSPSCDRASRAWLATDPATNPHSPPGPEYTPQYHESQNVEAAELNGLAKVDYNAGEKAGPNSDSYVRTTVLLARVLFPASTGSHFAYRGCRCGG
jgi:hypothetical protein